MLRNHLLIAWRNLTKYKFYSFINISGLAFGLAAFLFIMLYVKHELSYDKSHPYSERTYRVDGLGKLGEQIISSANVASPVGPTMKADFPEVEAFCRFRESGSFLVKYENRHHKEEKVIWTDSTFFQLFDVNLLEGDPKLALTEPNSLVLTGEMAEKYFGMDDPMGKTLTLDNNRQMKVTGIMEKMPKNSHLEYDILLALSTREESRETNWGNMNFNTYVVLQKGTDVPVFLEKMNEHLVWNYFAPEIEKYIGMPYAQFLEGGNKFEFQLFPLTDIHLHSAKDDELAANSDIKYVWIFSIIGLFILLIACINFMNLSTARSAIRAKEIGVRKVIGAMRQDLVGQFLGESMVVCFMALALAWCLVYLTLPYFNDLSGKSFLASDLATPGFVLVTIALAGLTGVLAGSYPAAFLSKFQPVKVLKGVFKVDNSKPHFRNGLVVFQFLITVFLICGTLVVYQQLNYIQNKKVGFERDHLVTLNDAEALGDNLLPFKAKMLEFPEVESASISGFLPVPSFSNSSSYFVGKDPTLESAVLINNWYIDFDYVNTMGMEILEGRDFDVNITTDSQAVIINERLAKHFEGDPVGQYLSNTGENPGEVELYQVVGVVKDFNFESLRENIEPLAFFIAGWGGGSLTMRLETDDLPGFINKLESNYTEMAPGQPFSYAFMDDRFDRMYHAEQRIGNIIGTFAFLAILIACIGLVGLSTFVAQQRTKEIGVRKVLGASTTSLIGLLSKDFLKLVLFALVIAVPLSWWAMSQWLQGFAYRIDLGYGVFAAAGIIALLLALATVSFQSVRAALANPVKSLRSE